MKKLCSVGALAALTAMGTIATAEENTGPWSGEASLAFTQNSGNTNSTSVDSRAKATNNGEKWREIYQFEGANEKTEDARTKEKYFASAKSEYKFEEKSYFFGMLEYTDDRFSGFNYEASLSLGYGHEFLKNEVHELATDFGIGYRQSELETNDEIVEEAFALFGLVYLWNINENASFDEDFSLEVGEEKTITKSYSRLKVRINGSLFGYVAYEIKHTSDVPPGTKNSDRTTMIGLNYTF